MIRNLKQSYKDMPNQVKASLWYVICGFIQRGISFLTTPIFTRLLTTEEYGIISVFNTWQNIIIIFASLNLASGVYLRGLIKYEDDEEEFTASLSSLYLVNFAVVFLIFVLFSDFWTMLIDLPIQYMLLMFVDMLVQTSYHFWSARQRVKYKYKPLVAVTFLNALLRPTIGVLSVINCSDKVTARITSMVVVDCVVFGYFFLSIFFKKGKKFSTKYWKYALAYNLPLIPHYLSQIVLNQSDRVMINSLVGSSEAGIYSLAYTVAAILTIVNQSISNSYNPWMYQKIRDKGYQEVGSVSESILVLVAVLNLVVIIFAPEVIAILAPASYSAAIWIIPPVTMSVYFMFLYGLFSNFEFYYEKTRYMMIASVAGAVLNIMLNYLFIPQFGYLAAGYTTLACYICYCVAHYILMKVILKKELPNQKIYNMKFIVAFSIVFCVVGFIFMGLYPYPVLRYLIILVGCVVAFCFRKKIIQEIKALLSLRKNKK